MLHAEMYTRGTVYACATLLEPRVRVHTRGTRAWIGEAPHSLDQLPSYLTRRTNRRAVTFRQLCLAYESRFITRTSTLSPLPRMGHIFAFVRVRYSIVYRKENGIGFYRK